MNTQEPIAVASEQAAPSEPLTLSVALRRNRFFRDEEGQAMVEFVIVGPFLLFLMMSIYHFWTIIDAKQDFYIAQRNLAFGAILGSPIGGDPGPGDDIGTRNMSMEYMGKTHSLTTKRSDQGFGTGAWLGADIIDIPNVVRFYPSIKVAFMSPYSSQVEHTFNAIAAAFNVNRPGRGTFSHFTQFGSGVDLNGLTDVLDLLGTPYQAMGLTCEDYLMPNETILGVNNVSARELSNPYRGILLGLGSVFLNLKGNQTMDTSSGFALDPIPVAARVPIIVDSWKANFVNGVKASPLQSEWFIQERAGGVTFFQGPYGFVTKLGMLLTSLNLTTFGLADGVLLREWDNLPYDNRELGNVIFDIITLIDPFQWDEHMKYKVERRDGNNEIPWRHLKALNGQNLVQSWK